MAASLMRRALYPPELTSAVEFPGLPTAMAPFHGGSICAGTIFRERFRCGEMSRARMQCWAVAHDNRPIEVSGRLHFDHPWINIYPEVAYVAISGLARSIFDVPRYPLVA